MKSQQHYLVTILWQSGMIYAVHGGNREANTPASIEKNILFNWKK